MDDFQRYILSIFVDLEEKNPGEFIRYYKIVELIRTNFREAKLDITTEQIDEAVNMLIDDGFLEGMGTSYRLSAIGRIYWENHSLLTELKELRADVKKAKDIALLALVGSAISIAAVVFFHMLR